MKRYFSTLKGPLIILLVMGVLSHIDTTNAFSVLFILIQIFAIASGGWLLSRDLKQSIGTASYSGPILLCIYILIVALLPAILFPPTMSMPANIQTKDLLFGSLYLTYLIGVSISYLLYLPVSMAIAAFGAYLNASNSKRINEQNSLTPHSSGTPDGTP